MLINSRIIRSLFLFTLIINLSLSISCKKAEVLPEETPSTGNPGGGTPGGGINASAACTPSTGGSGISCTDFSLYPSYPMATAPASTRAASCLAATPNQPIISMTPTFYYPGVPTYTISPALPAGISLDPNSGIISGTPTVSTGNDTLYTITVNTDIAGFYQCDFKYKVFTADTSGTSTSVGSMVTNWTASQSALLQNGNVLIVSGRILRTAEIFNPTAGTFTATGQMTRYGASTATTLPDGTVVIGGGFTTAGSVTAQLALEIYNPNSGTFSAAGVSLSRTPTDAILLQNGKVLFLSGASVCDVNSGVYTSYAAEIYNPATNTVTAAGFTGGKTGTLLPNGKVLVRGYQACIMNAVTGAYQTTSTAAAYLYDPSNSTYVATGSSYVFPSTTQAPLPRKGLVKTDGKVLFSDFDNSAGITAIQTYNTTTGAFTSSGKSTYYDAGFPVRENTDGTILLASPGRLVFSTYTPTTDTLVEGTAVMIYDHGANGSVTTLANGNILIVGKSDYGEYYKP